MPPSPDTIAASTRVNRATRAGRTPTRRHALRPAAGANARARTTLVAAATCAALGACGGGGGGESRGARAGDAHGRSGLAVETARRATIVGFAADTLSSAARILALYPGSGADSALVAFTFADSARHVSAGLGVLDLRAGDGGASAEAGASATHLAWPDSVRAVWWSAPHVLTFATATGRGVVVKVDVGADTLGFAVDSNGGRQPAPAAPPTTTPGATKAAVDRAIAFVDSAHGQPVGRPAPRAALRYAVDSLIAAPNGRLVALHVTAADSAGRRLNPAWYALALPSGNVASIDSVVGPASELPARAGAWGGASGETFYYARGVGVYQVRVR